MDPISIARLADDGGPHAGEPHENDGSEWDGGQPPYPFGWDCVAPTDWQPHADTDPSVKVGPVADGPGQSDEWDDSVRYSGREDIIRELIRHGIRIEDTGLAKLGAPHLRELLEDIRKLVSS